MTSYKLTYFDVRALGEPIRMILSYMGKEFHDDRILYEDWLKLKTSTPFGKIPILKVNNKLYHQSTAIMRYLAIEAGLTGNNAVENLEIDMVVGAIGDFQTEIAKYFNKDLESVKEKIKETLVNETVPFYMTKLENAYKNNGGYLANGKLSWADLFFVGYVSSLPGILEIDLEEKYPFYKELQDKVHGLPGIKDWVKLRPHTII